MKYGYLQWFPRTERAQVWELYISQHTLNNTTLTNDKPISLAVRCDSLWFYRCPICGKESLWMLGFIKAPKFTDVCCSQECELKFKERYRID